MPLLPTRSTSEIAPIPGDRTGNRVIRKHVIQPHEKREDAFPCTVQ
jgi:hypothetical protein